MPRYTRLALRDPHMPHLVDITSESSISVHNHHNFAVRNIFSYKFPWGAPPPHLSSERAWFFDTWRTLGLLSIVATDRHFLSINFIWLVMGCGRSDLSTC